MRFTCYFSDLPPRAAGPAFRRPAARHAAGALAVVGGAAAVVGFLPNPNRAPPLVGRDPGAAWAAVRCRGAAVGLGLWSAPAAAGLARLWVGAGAERRLGPARGAALL